MKLINYLLSFLLLTSLSAQMVAQNDSFTFHWGELTNPIIKDEDGNWVVKFFTELSTLKGVIDYPIFIRKNNTRIELESFGVSVFNPIKGKPEFFFMIDEYNPRKAAKIHGNEKIGHSLKPSIHLFLFNAKTTDGFTFLVDINTEQTTNHFTPNFKLPTIPKGEVFEFQVISFEDEQTMLRIDTTNEATQHIAKIYANPEKYKTIHIPNFKTTRRLISEVDFIDLQVKPAVLIKNNTITNLSFDKIPEFSNYSIEKKPFLLEWGELQNITIKEIETEQGITHRMAQNTYAPSAIKDALGNPILISLGYQDFEILKMRVSIIPENGVTTSFITDHLDYSEIEQALENVPHRSVILFDEIVIKGKDGEPTFLPPAFQLLID